MSSLYTRVRSENTDRQSSDTANPVLSANSVLEARLDGLSGAKAAFEINFVKANMVQ